MRRRKQIRLKGYDYSLDGSYFITICVKDRAEILGEIVNGKMINSKYGDIVQCCWEALPMHHPNILIDELQVMPNHMHGIVIILDKICRDVQLNIPTGNYYSRISPKRGTLSVIVRTFKAAVTTECRTKGFSDFKWQSRFHDHIIRNERSLKRIREYIRKNPGRWVWDKENPKSEGLDDFDRWLTEEGKNTMPIRKK